MTQAMAPRLNAGGAIVHTASRAGAFWRDNVAQVKALRACSWGDIDAFIQSHDIDDTRADVGVVWPQSRISTAPNRPLIQFSAVQPTILSPI